MRWINLLFLGLFLAFTFAGAGTSLLAADVGPPRHAYPESDQHSDDALAEADVAEFCYQQGQICSKICDLNSRFEDKFDGCRQSCESRAFRCTRTACFRWPERQFVIAERFGGYRCAQ